MAHRWHFSKSSVYTATLDVQSMSYLHFLFLGLQMLMQITATIFYK